MEFSTRFLYAPGGAMGNAFPANSNAFLKSPVAEYPRASPQVVTNWSGFFS